MTRDYGRRPPVRQRSNAPQQVLIIAFSFVLGYFTATVFDVEKLTSFMNTQVLASHEDKPKPQKPVPTHEAQLPPKPKFEFYTLLANEKGKPNTTTPQSEPTNQAAQVVAAKPVESQATQAVKTTESSKQPTKSAYLVQVAAFKLRKDAEQMKALLTLKGYDVNVMAITKQGSEWFRVVVGPYQNKNLALKAQMVLVKNERLKGMIIGG